jgi:hypothetical protein
VPDVALWDLVAPYSLLGNAAGNAHAAFSVLAVDNYEQAHDGTTTVIRGRALFHGDIDAFFDPTTMSFGVTAQNTEGHPKDDPSRRDPWIDLRDTAVDFQLVAPRVGSPVIEAGHTTNADPDPGDPFAPTDAVLDELDLLPVDSPPSDYPSTDFTLDLVFTTAVLRPPFLSPAKLRADGLLEPDDSRTSVTLTLPKIKVRIRQDVTTGHQPVLSLESVGATGIDDPGDLGVAQFVTMDPPYAFIGSGRVVGFGFRSAVLDLSDATTPADVLDQFGFDPSWTGIYFPEIRLFLAPQGAEGLAVNAGVRNLLIGIGDHAGVTGDFELDVINQGGGPLDIGARFSTPGGRMVGVRIVAPDTGLVELPATSTMIVDVGGRRPPYTVEISLDGGSTFTTDRMATVDMSTSPTRSIVIRATTPDEPTPGVLTIRATRRDESGGDGSPPPPSNTPPARVTVTATTRDGDSVAAPRLVIASQTDSTVTLQLEDRSEADWEVDGVAVAGGPTAATTVELAPGSSKQIRATGPTVQTKAPVYFHYDEPEQPSQNTDPQLTGFAAIPELTRTAPSVNSETSTQWTGGTRVTASSEYRKALESLSPGDPIVVVGHASWEGPYSSSQVEAAKETYNRLLSERRAKVAKHLYDQLAGVGQLNISLEPRGFTNAKIEQQADPVGNTRNKYWRAELKNPISVPGPITTGTVERDPVDTPPPAPTDPPPAEPERPDFFRSLGAKVRIVRDDFVAVELHGEVDFDTATEEAMRGQVSDADVPAFSGLGHQNPGDGIVQFRGVFTLDPGSDEWGLTILFGSHPSDVDGLVMTGSLPGQPLATPSIGRDLLGLYALFFPLMSSAAPETPGTADIEDIVLAGAAAALPAALAATGWFTVERVVWYGGEVLVRRRSGEWTTVLLLDVETAVSADIQLGGLRLLSISRDVPLVARYKAIGVRFGQDATGEVIFHPVFEASKGYTLDLARPGSLTVAEPLDQLLKVTGARISRTNPTYLEIELGSSVDLGVVSLDRAGVRIELADPVAVELTALGVSVEVPGALSGSGYLSFNEKGFAGRVDVTLTPLQLRIAAALRIEEITDGARTATGVAIALEVEFPVAIPLWSSGLGIYGFLGLFAMHFTRNEDPDAASTTKALSWLKRANGDPTQIEKAELWKGEIDHWAFGLGAIVGTMGSSIIFNMKGVVLIELPGPRLLLMMKANVLFPMPELEGQGEGALLAVVDLDVGRETLTIGLTIDFTIEPLLELRIPVEAFFDGKEPKNWHLFLGQYSDKIRASIFGVFTGSGYLMLMGDAANNTAQLPAALPRPNGFAIATGMQVSMLWGSKSIGLYAELSAGFDAILGFSPLLVAGVITARGELRLFILWLSAHAKLNVRLGELPGSSPPESGYKIDGEVCGKVSFFFFDIEGCISFTLQDNALPPVVIQDLVEGTSLVSRSPALVHGTASDEPVDGAFGNAIHGTEPAWNSLPADPADDTAAQAAIRKAMNIPINVIPVVMFTAPPLANGVTFEGQAIVNSSGGRTIIRSSDKITYTLESVDLVGPISAGNKPATWWTLHPPTHANESAQLALLSWVPNPTPKALQRSDQLTETVIDRWGTVCDEAAPPTPVLWTFRFEPIGPSETGWDVDGEAWPDPPDTVRSVPTPTDMRVWERWRSGDPLVDDYLGVLPAHVVGALVWCLPENKGEPAVSAGSLRQQPRIVARETGAGFMTAGELAAGRKMTERLVEPTVTAPELIRRLAVGEEVPRASTAEVRAAPAIVGATAPPFDQCESRVLASPRFDLLAPPETDPELAEEIRERWEIADFEPGDLHNAVVLEPGCFERARVLMFVPRRLLVAEQLVVRAVDPGLVDEVVVNVGHLVSVPTLPGPWLDAEGPWIDDIALVVQHFHTFAELDHQHELVLVEVAGEAEQIVIGLHDAALDRSLPTSAFYVAAVEALSCAEVRRHDHDSHTVELDQAGLEASLGAASGNVALLEPDTAYEVRVTWSAEAEDADGNKSNKGSTPESFWFRTAAEAPARLDPWILATKPYQNEKHVFGHEPLHLAFATNDMIDLFDAYDERLEVRISAASSRHPDPAKTGFPHPYPIDWTTTDAIVATVLSPWEETVAAVADKECIEVDEERVRHSTTTIPIPLEPATDYLLDIFRVPKIAPDGTIGERVFRRSFSTSTFATLAAYCEYMMGTKVRHRAVPAGLAASIKSKFASKKPQGAEFDNALQGSAAQPGIEPMGVPSRPSVIVWWEADGPVPQPVAVMIDGIEPLWRQRERATLVTVPNTDMKHWELTRDDWIEPVETAVSDGVVEGIIEAPGSQRALLIIKPNSRGKRLQVALKRIAFTDEYLDGAGATDEFETIADVAFDHAPWEEV